MSMNDDQRRLFSIALGNLAHAVRVAQDTFDTHGGTPEDDAKVMSALAQAREIAVACETAYEHHVGAAELLRRAGARAKTLSSSKKG